MKRYLTHAMIVAYLGALAFGLFAHTFKFKNYAHPGMYFIVWDMFCGWSGYDVRNHMIAEGEGPTAAAKDENGVKWHFNLYYRF